MSMPGSGSLLDVPVCAMAPHVPCLNWPLCWPTEIRLLRQLSAAALLHEAYLTSSCLLVFFLVGVFPNLPPFA